MTLALPGKVMLRPTEWGLMFFHANDRFIGQALLRYGQYSPGETFLLKQIIGPDTVVVEVGAHIGTHTVAMSKLGAKKIIALEPQLKLFEYLCANLLINGCDNVQPINAAFGAKAETMEYPVVDESVVHNSGGVSLHVCAASHDGPVATTPVGTLDSLGLSALGLLKLDCEGMEHAVLMGGAETIKRCRPAIYCENDRRALSHTLISRLDLLGYDCWWHLPPLVAPKASALAGEDLTGYISQNMLCLPKELGASVPDMVQVTDALDWPEGVP
jgi:FkbM family methyltransferase